MKNKLIGAMLVLTFQINGMEERQSLESDNNLQFSMDGISYSSQYRVDELNKYYQNQSELWDNNTFIHIDNMFNKDYRISFFETLVSKKNDITDDEAMKKYVSSCGKDLIKSPDYFNAEEFNKYDFLNNFSKDLKTITKHYARKVRLAAR